MNCSDCREQLYPENPEAYAYHNGRYYPPLCEGCSYKKIEPIAQKVERKPYRIQQLEGRVAFLQNKLNEHLDASKRQRQRYKGLKVEAAQDK